MAGESEFPRRFLLTCLLHVLHKRHALQQRAVAARLGVSSQLLTDVKADRRPMSAKLSKTITDVFGIEWSAVEAALPPEWRDKAAMLERYSNDKALMSFPEEDRYYGALSRELSRMDVEAFPSLREPEPSIPGEAATFLPVLDRPTRGDPLASEFFTGNYSPLPAPAVPLVKRADRPYLLRLLNGDHEGRFFAGDLLLVDQDISDMSSRVLAVRRHDDFGLVRWSVEHEDEFHPIHINPRPPLKDCIKNGEVVGVVKAVVWSPVKQRWLY